MNTTYYLNATYRREISRILTAAVINQRFCKLLLNDPETALKLGFNGEQFQLETEVKERFLSIHARTLAELAGQLSADMESDRILSTNQIKAYNLNLLA